MENLLKDYIYDIEYNYFKELIVTDSLIGNYEDETMLMIDEMLQDCIYNPIDHQTLQSGLSTISNAKENLHEVRENLIEAISEIYIEYDIRFYEEFEEISTEAYYERACEAFG